MYHSEEDDSEPLTEERLEGIVIGESDGNDSDKCRDGSMEDGCA